MTCALLLCRTLSVARGAVTQPLRRADEQQSPRKVNPTLAPAPPSRACVHLFIREHTLQASLPRIQLSSCLGHRLGPRTLHRRHLVRRKRFGHIESDHARRHSRALLSRQRVGRVIPLDEFLPSPLARRRWSEGGRAPCVVGELSGRRPCPLRPWRALLLLVKRL